MVDTRLPSMDDRLLQTEVARLLASRRGQGLPSTPAPSEPKRPTIVGGGLRAGFNELQALSGAAVAAVGKATGSERLERFGTETAAKNFAEAEQFGRPDLEVAPWREGGAPVLPWLGYQTTKIIPQTVGSAALGAATGGVGLVAAGATKAALGLGTAAARQAATKQVAKQALGTAYKRGAVAGLYGAGTVVGAGSMYSEAVERGDPTEADARRALMLAPLYGAVEAVPEALIGKMVLRGGTAATVGRRMVGGALMGAAVEGPAEGVQTALENTFRPDLSPAEKARRIVDAAITGAAVGGTIGSVGGIRRARGATPDEIDTSALSDMVGADVGADVGAPQDSPGSEGSTPAETAPVTSRPLERAAPDDLVRAAEQALVAVNDPATDEATRAAAAQTLSQVQGEIGARLDVAPAAQLTDAQLAGQAQQARQRIEAGDEVASARLAEVQAETARRTLESEQSEPALPGLEDHVPARTPEQRQAAQERKTERRVRRLARQFLSSQNEEATPSREAEKLGLTPYTSKEFEQRADKSREQLRQAVEALKEARARQAEVDGQSTATTQVKAKARDRVTKAEQQFAQAEKTARKVTGEIRLREAVIALAEDVEFDSTRLREPVVAEDTTARTVADALAALSPSASRQRRQAMRDAGITLETPFTLARADNSGPVVNIPLGTMLDKNATARMLRVAGVVTTQQDARRAAQRLARGAARGAKGLEASMAQMGLVLAPASAQTSVEVRASTLQPGEIPPAQVRQGVSGTTARSEVPPLLARMRAPAPVAAPPRPLATVQREVPPTSAVRAVRAPETAPVVPPRTPAEAHGTIQRVVAAAGRAARKLIETPFMELAPAVRREALAWYDMQTIESLHSRTFDAPHLTRLRELNNLKKKVIGHFSPLGSHVSKAFRQLKPTAQEKIMRLMELTAYDVSYEATWDEHTHHHGHPAEDFLRERHREAVSLYESLPPNGGRKVLDDMAALNRADALESQIRRMHSLLQADYALQGRDDFRQVVGRRGYDAIVRRRLREPRQIVASLRADREELIRIVTDAVGRKRQEAARADVAEAKQEELTLMADALDQTLADVKDETTRDALIPYFHKGRFGDYRVSFRLSPAQDEKGVAAANVEAETALAEALAAQGITGVGVQERGPTRSVMMRFETIGEANAAFGVAARLAEQGFIVRESLKKAAEDSVSVPQSAAEQFKNGLIEKIGALTSTTTDDEGGKSRAQKLAELRAVVENYFLETSPANSIRRVLVHRRNVHGYSRDMHRAFVHRWQVGVTNAAGAIAAAPRAKVYQDMRAEIAATGTRGEDRTFVQQALLSEMRQRDSVVDVKPNSLTGSIRAVNHAWYLGMSPAYMLMTVAHVPIITLPRLGAKFGYKNASARLLEAAPEAARVVKVLVRNSMNLQDFGEATFTNLSPKVLQDEFLQYDAENRPTRQSEEFVEMLLRLAETATIDLGGQMRELGRIAEGRHNSVVDHIVRTYGAPGFYSEVYSRLVTGIAAYRMFEKQGLRDEALIDATANVIHETMLDYSSTNIGRRTGEKGFAGPITPIVTAFQQYSFQVLGMLYREYHKLYTHNEPDPARRAEARKFLAGHLAAVTVFAGSMGLPFAAPASRAVESLTGTLFRDENDEPLDLDTAYRNYLADTFGPDVGEVLARGVPRAFGLDLSTRLGEQNLLPFSRLLSDRRFLLDQAGSMEAIQDAAMRRLGAPLGIPANIASAVPALMSGDFVKAGAVGAPVALSSLFKAYTLARDGYTDRNGNPVSITPGAREILAQAAGVTPAEKAELSAADHSLRLYDMRTGVRKNTIRNHIAAAIRDGDSDAAQQWMHEAVAFDRANPGAPMLPTLMSTLTRRFEESAVARALGVPRGTDLKNPAHWAMVRFGNY